MSDEPLNDDAPELAVILGLGRLNINDCSDEEVRLARLLHEPWADETLEAMMPSDRSIALKQARMALVYARRDSTAEDSITARSGENDRTPEQVARGNAEKYDRWPNGWGPFHRHFASDEIHRDADCDNPAARRRVWVFETGHLDEHERHIAERERGIGQAGVVERVRTLCDDADDYFHLNESPATAVRAVPVADLRAAIAEHRSGRTEGNDDDAH